MYKRSLLKRNIKRSWMSARNFNRFSVTSAWKNSWTQLFGSRSDWLILAAWLLPLSVIFLSLVACVPLAAFSVTGGDGADGACQSACPHHSIIVCLRSSRVSVCNCCSYELLQERILLLRGERRLALCSVVNMAYFQSSHNIFFSEIAFEK